MKKRGVRVVISRPVILAALLAAIVLIGGCRKLFISSEDCIDKALEQLEKKYGEAFEYVGSDYVNIDSSTINTVNFLASCASIPGKEIAVAINIYDLTVEDNYMNYYYIPQTAEYIESIASMYFDDSTAVIKYTHVPASEDISPDTMDFEEFISGDNAVLGHVLVDYLDEYVLNDFINALNNHLHVYFLWIASPPNVGNYYVYRSGDETKIRYDDSFLIAYNGNKVEHIHIGRSVDQDE